MKGLFFRQLVSLLLLYLFIFICLTGIVLYIVPPTRVAIDLQWLLFGLEKGDYIRLHTIFSFAFLLLALVHIYYNRRVLSQALSLQSRAGKWKTESLAALLITLLLLVLVLTDLPPVPQIMDFGQQYKDSWGGPGGHGLGRERHARELSGQE